MTKKTKNIFFKFFLLVFIVFGLILNYNSVDNSITEEDREFIPLYLKDIQPISDSADYFSQLKFIISIQKSVFKIAPQYDSIPFYKEREPKDLYYAKSGLCYDRSRVIEKILRFSGFKTRHVSFYSTKKTNSALISLLKSGVLSHAVSEVLTKKGWLVIDSNSPWVSIDINKKPISINKIKLNTTDSSKIKWNNKPPIYLYEEPFTYVYGLYSRHGKAYPPYNFIPDINYSEFIQNL